MCQGSAMRRALYVIALLALGLPAATGCARSTEAAERQDTGGLPDGDPALAKRLVADGALLVDVRTPAEFASLHLDGAKNVPVDTLDDGVEEIAALVADKNAPIVVYCRSGARSARAKERLVAAGYTKVTNLGGIDAWR